MENLMQTSSRENAMNSHAAITSLKSYQYFANLVSYIPNNSCKLIVQSRSLIISQFSFLGTTISYPGVAVYFLMHHVSRHIITCLMLLMLMLVIGFSYSQSDLFIVKFPINLKTLTPFNNLCLDPLSREELENSDFSSYLIFSLFTWNSVRPFLDQ